MTAAIAKTQHRRHWAMIHRQACKMLSIDPDRDIDRFMSVASFISDFTDRFSHPPRFKDFPAL